jgi:DNA invertase Pin-like site-specific DNA recombinase
MSTKKRINASQRTIALCYVRLSFTRDDDDTNSPDRQRANIQAVCDKYGWTPEWYEDVGGHRSGRSEKNRPQWLALKARLGDPDVIALVANDLSRLHRKGWRVGDLIEYLNEHNVNLVLAAPGREIDTTTNTGRMFLQFGAIVDEYYAEDIAQRARDSVAYRKAKGISIGLPPFGAVRNSEGYLMPTSEGAWLLPNGSFIAGVAGQETTRPIDGAIWRGYYDAAHYILQLYAEGNLGLEKISYKLNNEGWAYRDREGQPRPLERDDIRRVVANWAEYGGLLGKKSGKDRPAYEKINVDEIVFREERAIFPIPLLRKVAQVRQDRSVKPSGHGVNINTRYFALASIMYCAHCERLAVEQNNPKSRTTLTGFGGNGVLRYRHRQGVRCGCENRSVRCEIVEADFTRLIKLLTIKQDAVNLMLDLAIQADKTARIGKNEKDLEQEKQEAIAVCHRRIEAAVNLYGDGRIERAEYLRRVEANEREIAHWEARTTDTEKLSVELAMCIEAVERISRLWTISSDEDRQALTRSLFSEIIYDLDQQRIVSFKLKAWADRYIILREALYETEDQEPRQPKSDPTYTDVSENSLWGIRCLTY